MISPGRLTESGTAFERDVLESARLDVGSDQGLKRTLVAMGLGAAALSTTTLTAGTGIAAGATATAAAGGVGIVTVVKWVGLAAVVAGSATAASAHWVAREGRAAAESSASRTVIARPSPSVTYSIPTTAAPALPPTILEPPSRLAATEEPTAVAIAPTAPESTPASRHPSLPVAPAANSVKMASSEPPVETPPARSAPSTENRPLSLLNAEIAALDEVRAALARGEARHALDALSDYDRTYPASVFVEEAAVLRIDAMMLLGDRAAAVVLSRRFIAAHPSSPHAGHVRKVMAVQNP